MIPFPEISPEIYSVTLFGFELALRWYALAYIIGIVIGWRIVVTALKQPRLWTDPGAPMTLRQCEDLLTWVILGVILGGRLGYVLFYQFAEYMSRPSDILKIWQGGMSFHGGMLGFIITAWIFTQRQNIPKMLASDVLVLGVWPGLLLGRIANFINAELWGRPTDLPWGVVFPGYGAQNCGQALDTFCARHPSQLYEALLEGVILGAVLLWMAWKRDALQLPGRLTGVFFAGYGLARFIVEFVRQPDAQFASEGNPLGLALHLGGYGLTMGQILSLPMLLVGVWLIARSRRV